MPHTWGFFTAPNIIQTAFALLFFSLFFCSNVRNRWFFTSCHFTCKSPDLHLHSSIVI